MWFGVVKLVDRSTCVGHALRKDLPLAMDGMIPAYIIEQLRKRERARQEVYQQPVLELPLPPQPLEREGSDEDTDRGVCIIQIT